jgi:chemotaxis regulatin CheY-phosphate phosphatase CheZ
MSYYENTETVHELQNRIERTQKLYTSLVCAIINAKDFETLRDNVKKELIDIIETVQRRREGCDDWSEF